MRIPRQRQIFLALCALDEFAEQARERPIAPSFALRFALAFLWSCSDGRARGSYDGVWRNLLGLDPETADQRQRHAFARSQLNGIMLSLGLHPEAMQQSIDRARKRPAGRRPAGKLWGSMTEEEKRDHARRSRECLIQRTDQPFPTLKP